MNSRQRLGAGSQRDIGSDDDDDIESGSEAHPEFHAAVDGTTFLTRKLAHISLLIEVLQQPQRAVSYTSRDMVTLLQYLSMRNVYISKAIIALFVQEASPKNRSRVSSPDKPTRPNTSERPNTPLSGAIPASPYLQLIVSSGSSYPPVCLSIAAGRNTVRSSSMTHQRGDDSSTHALREESVLEVEGIGIDARSHCLIHRTGDGNAIAVEPGPNTSSRLYVNGVRVEAHVPLAHGDVLCFGIYSFFQLNIPFVANLKLEADSVSTESYSEEVPLGTRLCSPWEHCLLQSYSRFISREYERGMLDAINAGKNKEDRYSDKIRECTRGSQPDHAVEEESAPIPYALLRQVCEITAAVDVINYYSFILRKRKDFQLALKFTAFECHEQVASSLSGAVALRVGIDAETIAVLRVVVICAPADRGSWSWDSAKFLHRLYLIEDMVFDLYYRCNGSLMTLETMYPPELDPFYDAFHDELIGVVSVHNGPLLYLLDIIDTLPIVSFQGYTVGLLKIHARAWLDKIEDNPPYISLDEDMNLENHIGRVLVITYTYEKIIDIPELISSDVFVQLKFYHHGRPYRSTRYHGKSTSPYLGARIAVQQEITPDFVDFLKSSSVDLEVLGRRGGEISSGTRRKSHSVGEFDQGLRRKAKVCCHFNKMQIRDNYDAIMRVG